MQVWDVSRSGVELDVAQRIELEQGGLAVDAGVTAGRVVVLRDRDGHHRYALVEGVTREAGRVRLAMFVGELVDDEDLASLELTHPPRTHQRVEVDDVAELLALLRRDRAMAGVGPAR